MYIYVCLQVLGTPYVLNLLHILQSMVLIERDSSDAEMVWPLLEEMTEKAVLMNEPERIEVFRRKSLEIITEALRRRKSNTAGEFTFINILHQYHVLYRCSVVTYNINLRFFFPASSF